MPNSGKTAKKRSRKMAGTNKKVSQSNKARTRVSRSTRGVTGDNLQPGPNDDRNNTYPNENNRRNLPLRHNITEIEASPVSGASISTRFICKVCGNTFDDQDLLNEHIDILHQQKRTVTSSDIIERVFEGNINFPKTKAEIVRYVEENKEKNKSVTPAVIDTLKNIPDRMYNDEADLVLGLEQQREVMPSSAS